MFDVTASQTIMIVGLAAVFVVAEWVQIWLKHRIRGKKVNA
jgi:hypothetical protein